MLAELIRRRSPPPFDYHIRYSSRKTLGIYVSAAGVEVRAPKGASKKWIDGFVYDKSEWVQQKLKSQREKAAQSFRLEDQQEITLLGQPLLIDVQPGARNRIQLVENRLVFSLKTPESTALSPLFSRWMLSYARDYMTPITHAKAESIEHARSVKEVRFRRTKSKWGHCSSTGVIQFNWLIMLAPPAVVDYLIAHEVCHLVHLNHSKAYWDLVASICPDYQVQRKWLRDHEHRFRLVGL